MSNELEINKLLEINSTNPKGLMSYTIPKGIDKSSLFESLISHVNNTPMSPINGSKNFKMEHYYPLLEFVVNEMNKIYFEKPSDLNTINNLDNILSCNLLSKLTMLVKGQTLLNKLVHRIPKVIAHKKTIMSLLMESARTGPFLTFLFWLNRYPDKSIEKLERAELEEIFILSIGNSDDRLFRFVLEKVLKTDKLFFQKNTSTITSMITTLANSLVPAKYQLKRIKLLSGYISLVPFFHQMINNFNSEKVIVELHKHYYVNPHTFESLRNLLRVFVTHNWDQDGINIINNENYNKLVPLFKTEQETIILNILLSLQFDLVIIDKIKKSIVNKIVQDNYNQIIELIDWGNLSTKNDIIKYVVSSIVEQNLVNKYIEAHNIFFVNQEILFYTRFVKVPPFNENKGKNNSFLKVIRINKLLHKLRLYVKSKCKNRVIQHKVKMFDLLREISTFSPKVSVPVLARGSSQFQFQKQKFTNLPPRHLLPGEISIYNNFMLKEKADGVLINNMPVGIYPYADILNNYQVKAEYIEDLDLYLVFDIDIPNTTIDERYSALRNAHPYTTNTGINKINSFDDFIKLFCKERIMIKRFINDNKTEPIKWYPKFACIYNSNETNIHKELICNVILEQDEEIKETIANSEPFKCDGLILTPINGTREIKIKPKSMMTIDLLFDGKKWVDRNGYDWSNLIIKPKTAKKEGRIYRCYPTETFDKFTVGEFRFDKKKPNPYNIVDNIVTMIQYDWESDTKIIDSYYYDSVKKITSKSLINTINTQVENLSNQIALMEPEFNKSWLDLGCGRGKLIPLIKKFNPKKYLGLDVDVKQLIKGIQFHDENQDVYVFTPCNLSGNWTNTPIKWHQINKSIKYDYIIANFALMHFCTDEFWSQLNAITHENTKFVFNVVCPPTDTDSWAESESYLRVEGNQTIYKFEWTHDEEKTEPFISDEELGEIVKRNGWNVQEKRTISSKHKLINFYKWWIISKC
jgi:hypothetical protein